MLSYWCIKLFFDSLRISLARANMVSGRYSPNLSTVVSGLHLIFTLASVAFLSYKGYNLENELSLIRRELPTQAARKSSNVGINVNATPLTKFQGIEDQEQRSRRNRQAGKRKSESSTSDKLKTVCVQKLLSNLQVCCVPLFSWRKRIQIANCGLATWLSNWSLSR